jgi:hypothetical protein
MFDIFTIWAAKNRYRLIVVGMIANRADGFFFAATGGFWFG